MADVARHAGVSPQTVSRVSNGAPNVTDETRRRVLESMGALGYRPNSAARALKRGSFRSIGVVLTSLSTAGDSMILRGIVDAAMPHGYTVTLLTIGTASGRTIEGASARLHESAVDGAVIIADAEAVGPENLRTLGREPLVLVSAVPSESYWIVDTDQASGVAAAVTHLLELGHQNVHHVAGPRHSLSARRREESWRGVLEANGRVAPPVIYGDWSSDSGYAAGQLLARDPDVTAVFAADDDMALGIERAFHEGGIRIPQDVSLVGFDDIAAARNFPVPLTTVHQDLHAIGERCVERVLQQVASGSRTAGTDLIPGALVVRESTAAPRSRSGV